MFGFVKRLMNSKIYYCHIDSEPVSFAYDVEGLLFSYRRQVIVTEQSGNALIDYQVLIELNSSNFDFSHANSDGSDIRFYDENNFLNYWIEKWDSVNQEAKIWVKVPNISANGTTSFYMYYENPGIVSASNGEDTFEFFDDFETLNESIWSQDSGTWQVETFDGVSTVAIEPDTDNNYLRAVNTNFSNNFIVETRLYTTQAGDSWAHPGILFYGTSGYNDQIYFRPHVTNYPIVKAYYDGTLYQQENTNLYIVGWDTWYIIGVALLGDTVKLYSNYEYKYTFSGCVYDGIYANIGLVAHAQGKDYFDWIRVRKYADPEPSVSIGNEETP